MIVLWIVLGVLVVVVGVSSVVLVRRRAPVPPPAPPAPARPLPEAAPAPAAPPTEPAATEAAPAPPVHPARIEERLGKTRGVFAALRALRLRPSIDSGVWEELEEVLLRADVGLPTTEELRHRLDSRSVGGGEELLTALEDELRAMLSTQDRSLRFDPESGVTNVWLFLGVNGVGKTTTVAKVAKREMAAGKRVLLAAGDTFRAAAGEQLAQWADRIGAEIVQGAEGGDPSAVVFDAVQRAAARGNDLVLADTAGRLHTRVNLVEELKKIRRVADRPPGRVSEVLLVLDATTGQNALTQARLFTEAVGVTGVVLTKLDGSAKGGVVVAIERQLGLPVKLVGLGEGPDDLVPFDPGAFVAALLG